MTRPGQPAFDAHIELLRFFLLRRDGIVERIQIVLNAQGKPIEYLRDGHALFRHFEDGFFAAGVTSSQAGLRGQLEEAHAAGGFRPREMPGVHNGLIDPAEMMTRVFYLWQQTRWPGRNGRIKYAHTLFNLYVLRCLELLSVHVCDEAAGDRLRQLQGVLDQLWATTPPDQPVFVRDARWLIQLAQSPATDDLGAYFEVAQNVAETLPAQDRLAIHSAGVRMTAGHLRSQTRYLSIKKAVPLDDRSLILTTRNSNALDFALLIQELVPLLEAYEQALRTEDGGKRLQLAEVICQGISADPELFVNRVALLGAYSMIEHLFITTTPDEHVAYTPMGRRHVQLIREYGALIGRLATALSEDCSRFRPVGGACSPYGVVYGFSSHLIEHMALKASQPDAATRFSLEDVFDGSDTDGDKLAWVNGWRKLPHLTREVEKQFDYPQQFAEDMFERTSRALRGGASATTGRLFVGGDARHEVPNLPERYIGSSDARDRREGKYVLSYQTAGGWVAITKDVLTEVLGAGRDVKPAGLPRVAIETLTLMCPGLVHVSRDLPGALA